MTVKTPIFQSIVINSQNVTAQLAPDIIEYQFDSVLKGGASSIEFTLRNFSLNTPVAPVMGDYIEVKIQYEEDGAIVPLNSGTLRIDFIERTGLPDVIKYSATSFDYGLGLSNFSNQVYTNRTMSSIVQELATAANITVLGEPTADIVGTSPTAVGNRVLQVQGTRLRLLQDLADTYGFFMNLRLGFLIFRDIGVLEQQAPVFQIDLGDVTNYRVRLRGGNLFRTALTYYADNSAISIIDTTVPQDNNYDVSKEGFYANTGSATRRSIGVLASTNRGRHIMYLNMAGNYLYAGDVVRIVNTSFDNGKYICMRAVHNFTPEGGWTMDVELDKVFGANSQINP